MNGVQRLQNAPLGVSRALALVLAIAVPSLVALLVISPIAWLLSGDAWRAPAREQLAQDRAWAATAAQIDERLGALKTSAEWQRFYDARGADEGAAMLLTDLRGILGRGGVSATSAIQMEGGASAPLPEIGARVVAVMAAPQLKQVLQEIASHARFLEVHRLSVTAPPFQQANENPSLMVTLEVVGFLDPRPRGEAT